MKIKEGGVMDIQKENNLIQEAFEVEADEVGFCLDQKWGDYENPYENSDTALAFNLFKKGWQAAKAQAVPDLGELQERIAGHQYYHDEHGHMIVDMDDVVKEISGFDSWKAQAVLEKDAIIQKLSNQLCEQEMKTSAARVLCETACELLDDYAHQDAMVILDDLEQVMKEPAND